MSREPNAILAINSLDRYITARVPTLTYFNGDWGLGLNFVVVSPQVQPVGASPPQVGSVLTANGLSLYDRDLSGAPFITDVVYSTRLGNNLVVNTTYTIVTLGDTNWVAAGAPSNTVGVTFVAKTDGNPSVSPGTAKWVSQANISKPTLSYQPDYVRIRQWAYSPNAAQQPESSILYSVYNKTLPYSNDFTIQSPGALIYGYIKHITVSQIQMQYNIPTICTGLNSTLPMSITTGGAIVNIEIPYGFYYPDELAAMLQMQIRAAVFPPDSITIDDMEVIFDIRIGFSFKSNNYNFLFPTPIDILYLYPQDYTADQITAVYKTYKLLGLGKGSATYRKEQRSSEYPNFLYTPYIDIYSDVLTNYQKIKDTNTSISKPKGLVARVYLSGTGNLQPTSVQDALGSAPFVVTADLNSPKIIRWSPDVAVPSIDFQLRDCYGDLIPGPKANFQTEFQMTLLCSEGDD